MASDSFSQLHTEQFRIKMRPHAIQIYCSIFPGSTIEDLREKGVKVHVLDKEFGIDALWHVPSGQWISIQEKYRKNQFLTSLHLRVNRACPDFTQEYKNAAGTPLETDGEWFKLGAQLYFYGWANAAETDFERWVILDVSRYKMTVERQGGLGAVGVLKRNDRHGKASFYAIPLERLHKAILLDSQTWHPMRP